MIKTQKENMIKNVRSKSLLIILCAFFSIPVQSNDWKNTIDMIATGAKALKYTAETIDTISNLPEGAVEDFLDNTNTLTWDLFVPLYVAYYSATATANNATKNNFSDTSALTQGAIAGLLGGGVTYVLGSIPKNLLKKLCKHFAIQKKSLEKSIN